MAPAKEDKMTGYFKNMDAARLAKLEALEKELGCCLVALEPEQIAQISQSQIKKLQSFEKESETILLAYSC